MHVIHGVYPRSGRIVRCSKSSAATTGITRPAIFVSYDIKKSCKYDFLYFVKKDSLGPKTYGKIDAVAAADARRFRWQDLRSLVRDTLFGLTD